MADAVFNLSELDGSNGFIVLGTDENARLGVSVSGAGDVNGDGLDDLILGAPDSAFFPYGAGQSYVIFGSSEGFDASLDLNSLNGSNGFVITGIGDDDILGDSVSGVGDINGDGLDDIIVGAPFAGGETEYSYSPYGGIVTGVRGESYVIFGSSEGFDASFDLSSLNGSSGFVIPGLGEEDGLGDSVSGAGDINGDGFDDLIIGAPTFPSYPFGAGQSYVVFGSSEGFDASLNLNELDGGNGFVIPGVDGGDRLGVSVSGAGDINGDGFDDLVVGAPLAGSEVNLDSEGNYLSLSERSGASYVVFGSSEVPSSIDLANLDGSNGFVIEGIDEDGELGASVSGIEDFISGAGDINDDGFDDLIVAAPFASPNSNFSAGESYVIFGSSGGFGSSVNLANLDGSNGFVIRGLDESDTLGLSVNGAGDINDDGSADLIVGAPFASPNSNFAAGESYVVFGSSGGFGSSIDLADLDGTNGFVLEGIDGGDNLGTSVSGTGDVNGDGIDDLVIGAEGADVDGKDSAGESYVVFGFRSSDGTEGNDTLSGTPSIDLLSGLGGNDTLTGGGNQDRFAIAAGEGTDTITDFGGVGTGINPAQAIVDEVDRLEFSGEGLTAENLLLTQNGTDLEIAFEGANNTQVILENFALENLDNLQGIGNILFDGQQTVQDSIDVLNANQSYSTIFNPNTVTFLNDLDNDTSGLNSDDVINAQGGDDTLSGLGGNDILRGGEGNDVLVGGAGNDSLQGNAGDDQFVLTLGAGQDTILGYQDGTDSFLLDGLTFEELSITQTGNQTSISVAQTQATLASIVGVQASDLDASDFALV